jgi:hypothetical protein
MASIRSAAVCTSFVLSFTATNVSDSISYDPDGQLQTNTIRLRHNSAGLSNYGYGLYTSQFRLVVRRVVRFRGRYRTVNKFYLSQRWFFCSYKLAACHLLSTWTRKRIRIPWGVWHFSPLPLRTLRQASFVNLPTSFNTISKNATGDGFLHLLTGRLWPARYLNT